MSESDRSPKDDFRDGLSLLLRAARTATQSWSVARAEAKLYEGGTQVLEALSRASKAFSDELTRAFASNKPNTPTQGADDPADAQDRKNNDSAS